MVDEELWKRVKKKVETHEKKIEKQVKHTRSTLGDDIEDIRDELKYQAEAMQEIESKIDEDDSDTSTWEDLKERDEFCDRSEKVQKILWELAKIEEGDSPKTQSDVAREYDVDRSRVSQLRKSLEKYSTS